MYKILGCVLVGCGVAGCASPHVVGTVDGVPVDGAADAFYDIFRLDFGALGSIDTLLVMITDFEEGCSLFDSFLSSSLGTCESRCESYVDLAAQSSLGATQWSVLLSVDVSGDVDGTYPHGRESEGVFSGEYREWNTDPLGDLDACIDSCRSATLFEGNTIPSTAGDLTLVEEVEGQISGNFGLDLGGADRLDGRFNATQCLMGDWLF